MKVFLRYFQVAALALAVSVLSTGCKEDSTDEGPKPVEPSLTAELVAATSTTAELRLTTTAITPAHDNGHHRGRLCRDQSGRRRP